MLQTKDLLYLVISFCIVWITVFLCWTFYYVMRLLRNANQIAEEFRGRLQILTETINYVRGKIEHMSGLMTLLSGGLSEYVKKTVTKKAKQWVDEGTEKFDESAKDAVEKAVEATAAHIKKAAHKMRK